MRLLTNSDFIEKSNKVHENKYDYSKYIRYIEKGVIINEF